MADGTRKSESAAAAKLFLRSMASSTFNASSVMGELIHQSF